MRFPTDKRGEPRRLPGQTKLRRKNMEKEKLKRINLPKAQANLLDEMLTTLKREESHLNINGSSLTAWILEAFYIKHFKREKQQIIDAHFNKKKFIEGGVHLAESEEELESFLNDALSKIRRKKSNRIPPKKRPQNAPVESAEMSAPGEIKDE